MAKHDVTKNQNRIRIKLAAVKIIREEGMAKLTMRHLAKAADVSLATPYNLFGSKTEVLISLLDESQEGLIDELRETPKGSELERLFRGVDHMERVFSSDEKFFRDVYWGIMSSDQPSARFNAFEQIIGLCDSILANAVVNREVQANADAKALGKHLATQLFAILGMWGSGFFENTEAAQQIKRSWCASLLIHSTRKSKSMLLQHYARTV
jgi:AcrR family transcriptional regulator